MTTNLSIGYTRYELPQDLGPAQIVNLLRCLRGLREISSVSTSDYTHSANVFRGAPVRIAVELESDPAMELAEWERLHPAVNEKAA